MIAWILLKLTSGVNGILSSLLFFLILVDDDPPFPRFIDPSWSLLDLLIPSSRVMSSCMGKFKDYSFRSFELSSGSIILSIIQLLIKLIAIEHILFLYIVQN